MARNHRNLKVFQMADALTLDVYEVTREFPQSELYGLVSQMRRAAVSVPANIVEGSARKTLNEYLNFLNIAFGSLTELGYMISLSYRLHFLNEQEFEDLNGKHDYCVRSLKRLMDSLEAKKNS